MLDLTITRKAIEQFPHKKIIVLGDVMLDHYTFGEVARISPEAPVPIFKKTDEKFVPGGAANVASNLVALGAKVIMVGVVGDDYSKKILKKILEERGISTKLLITDKARQTTLKHRFVSENQQLLRVDEEDEENLTQGLETIVIAAIEKEIAKCDGVIFSDYAKGFFSKKLVERILKISKQNRKITVADIKPVNKELFRGIDVITPNLKEAIEMSGSKDVRKSGKSLARYFSSEVVITKGSEGMSVFPKAGSATDFPTKKIKVFDVSGAGDTVISVITLGLVSGLKLQEAAYLANYAGGVVVQKPGTAAISLEELLSTLEEEHHVEMVSLVPKVWGYEKWLENNNKYCSKILSLKKGFQCSLHYHKIKDETFLVTKGQVRMEVGDKVLYMREGNFIRIIPGTVHRFRGVEDSEILEISTHHREDDSYRLEESRSVEL